MLTDFLKLFKADPTDGDKTFNITTMLNENWDKLNAWAKEINATTLLSITTGTAPNYMVEIPDLTLTAGTRVTIKFHLPTSSVATLKINNEVAYGIKKPDGTDFKNIKDGVYTLVFDGANFTLQGEGGEYGTATPDKILTGFTVGTESGLEEGTMPNRGNIGVVNLTGEGSECIIQEGYHNGLGKVRAVITGLVSSVIKAGTMVGGIVGTFTADATATASQMLSGVTAYVNGIKITGTIPSKGAQTYMPGTTDQTISANQFLSGAQTIKGDADLISANIKNGINIFGVVGTLEPKQYARGTFVAGTCSANTAYTAIMNLSFTPKVILITNQYGEVDFTRQNGALGFAYNLGFWTSYPYGGATQGYNAIKFNMGYGMEYAYFTIQDVTAYSFNFKFTSGATISGGYEWVAIG